MNETSPQTPAGPVCRACGMENAPGARFCRSCGASLDIASPACSSCGQANAPTARYCRQCGAALWPATPPRPAFRPSSARARPRRRFGVPALAAALAAVGLIGGVAWVALRIGGDGTTPPGPTREARVEQLGPAPGPGPSGLPQHPPLRLTHPAGAVVTVPAGEVLFSDYVDLRTIDRPRDTAAWKFAGAAWKFVSVTGVPHDGAVEVRLPAADAGAGAVVAMLAPSGSWRALPTVQEDDRLVAAVSGVPAPWVVAVAVPKSPAAPPSAEAVELAELERLAAVDPTAWAERAQAWLEANPAPEPDGAALPSPGVYAALGRSAALPVDDWMKLKQDYYRALIRLNAASAYLTAGGTRLVPGAATNAAAFSEYRVGILALLEIRDRWFAKRAAIAEFFGSPGDWSSVVLDDGVPFEDSFETALAAYAPWGIELTAALVRHQTIAGLDLSVIYGEALFTDVLVPPSSVPAIQREFPGRGWAADPDVTLRLRLFSRAAIENWSLLDYLKDWRTEAFIRYLPVALWALGLGAGGPGLLAVTLADQVLNTWQAQFETASDPLVYGQIQWATTAVAAAPLYFEATSDFIRASFGGEFNLAAHRANALSFIYSAAVSWAVTSSDWYLLKDIRAITAGTRGYCPNGACNWWYADGIPPVQLIATARGAPQRPADFYPATRIRVAAWNLQYNPATAAAGALDLHGLFRSGRPEALAQVSVAGGNLVGAKFLANLYWEPYATQSWVDATIDTSADLQAVRIALPKSQLARYREVSGAKVGAPIADYDLWLRLELPGGEFQRVRVVGVDEEASSRDRENIYLLAAWTTRDDASAEDLAPQYRGSRSQPVEVEHAAFSPLRTRYSAFLYASGEPEEDWLPLEIAFPAAPAPRTSADAAAAPRVHETLAAVRAEPPRRWVLTRVSFAEDFSSRDPFVLYQRTFWSRVQPDVCRIDLLNSSSGAELLLSCIFEPGCPSDDSCFSMPLATSDPSVVAGGRASLQVTRDRITGSWCNSYLAEGQTCPGESFFDAALDSSWTMSGSFGYRWAMPSATGTWTLTFDAAPAR